LDFDFFRNFSISVDLALEAREIVQGRTGQEIPGVRVDRETYSHASVTIVIIEDKAAESVMGKPVGTYITIEAPEISGRDPKAHHEIGLVVARMLSRLMNLPEKSNILVVGLGNWNATPDALGPKVVSQTMVTRHIFNYAPQELQPGMRSVSAMAPGVLGLTGIETAEVIKGVVEKIKPELVIAIDSLAAKNVARIATTIQIANTGVSPGSGVGNQRMGINAETLGVPVIAIGVPIVNSLPVVSESSLPKGGIPNINKMPDNLKEFLISRLPTGYSNMNLDERQKYLKKMRSKVEQFLETKQLGLIIEQEIIIDKSNI